MSGHLLQKLLFWVEMEGTGSRYNTTGGSSISLHLLALLAIDRGENRLSGFQNPAMRKTRMLAYLLGSASPNPTFTSSSEPSILYTLESRRKWVKSSLSFP
jgi:hypothetical protein